MTRLKVRSLKISEGKLTSEQRLHREALALALNISEENSGLKPGQSKTMRIRGKEIIVIYHENETKKPVAS